MEIKQRIIAEMLRLGFSLRDKQYWHPNGAKVDMLEYSVFFQRPVPWISGSLTYGFPESVIFAALQEAAK